MGGVKIKVKNEVTGEVNVFDAGEEDCMADVMDALSLNCEEWEVCDWQTGRHLDPETAFGETNKRAFVLRKG